MCVVPVMVKQKRSDREDKACAMLNSCSQATFAKGSLLSELGIQGRKASVTAKTMKEEVIK